MMLNWELLGVLLLSCTQILSEYRGGEFYGPRNQYGGHRGGYNNNNNNNPNSNNNYHVARTREVQIKYGRLRGTVVQPRGDNLQLVDVFLGVPYAEPPVGAHRFDPPKSQTPWTGVQNFVKFSPVCPQNLPNVGEEVDSARHRYLRRLLPYLQNQSEDCLYLNIYAPHQESHHRNAGSGGGPRKHPVIVFIHGESYEWNSGNPYDGSVLAAYGNIVFVTLNFRLGILGFLRPGVRDDTASNFGLMDQAAALAWLKDNVGPFGGDPDNITLLGHGTGAVFANLLLLGSFKNLVNRAILMSGSALNPDAIGKAPMQITMQVAFALNCPQLNETREFQACLRNRSVQDLLSVKIDKPKYVPAFAPLVDGSLIPASPHKIVEQNPEVLAKFDLMYGVTELEKFHVMPGVGLLQGLSNKDRDEFIRDSVKASHELEPDLILDEVLQYYGDEERRPRSGTKEKRNRDLTLEVVSDSGVVAGLVRTANLHSRSNPQSWMYVFTHPRSPRDHSFNQQQQIRHTVHGEELPYVLGVPLDGGGDGYHLSAPYHEGEVLLSKAIMDWWCNFAYSGNPNSMRPLSGSQSYLRDDYQPSSPYHTDWPEYDPDDQIYFNLTTPPQIGRAYRSEEAEFWNEAIPRLLRRPKAELSVMRNNKSASSRPQYSNSLDSFRDELWRQHVRNDTVVDSEASSSTNLDDPSKIDDKAAQREDGNALRGGTASTSSSDSAVSLIIGFGAAFLLINATALACLHRKRRRMRTKATASLGLLPRGLGRNHQDHHHHRHVGIVTLPGGGGKTLETAAATAGYCNSASKPDIRELIKSDKAYDNNSNFGRNSDASTIDTKIKVREWIQQEIVHRCSPRFLRKTRETLQREHREKLMKQQQYRRGEVENDEYAAPEEEEEEECRIRVRPGVRGAARKVSIGVDATPAARTDSVLEQIPIEVARSGEYLNSFEDAATTLGPSEYCEPTELNDDAAAAKTGKSGANIVVVEHHHSRNNLDKVPGYVVGGAKVIATARINESDSGSAASSLYAKINPRMKTRLAQQLKQQTNLQNQQPNQGTEVEVRRKPGAPMTNCGTLPRLLTFGSPATNPADVNVTSREEANLPQSVVEASDDGSSHEEAMRTIKRRNYPKVLPDIEKRRSLPPNASFVLGSSKHLPSFATLNRRYLTNQDPPSPPPRGLFGTSRSLDCVEDRNEDEEEENDEGATGNSMPVTTKLHVGPLRRKTDSPKNQSSPSLPDACSNSAAASQVVTLASLSSATSLPVCPIHGASSRERLLGQGARSEPRIVITPIMETTNERNALMSRQQRNEDKSVDQPDCPTPSRRPKIPERGTKLPRIIIKPTMVPPNGTLPRQQANRPVVGASNLQDNEAYQRLLARREKMPLPGEGAPPTRIPSFKRTEIVQRVNDQAAATKL